MTGPVATLIPGDRLHLQHGPIDLIIGADGDPDLRTKAFAAARAHFQTVLEGLVQDLPQHRSPLTDQTPDPADPVARRMYAAARPFAARHFLTPMIAVAGSVADEVLEVLPLAKLKRAYVNNGGDIAVHLAPGEGFSIAMATPSGKDLGRIRFRAGDGIGGIASSGAGGRSHSLGIAENVTVLAATAAAADTAATLIANAVNLKHPEVRRAPARTLSPDSDLGNRLVTTHVPRLHPKDILTALEKGEHLANTMIAAGCIKAAALFLQGQSVQIGKAFEPAKLEPHHA